AACASTRPSNALPALLRAQCAASSLAASLEVVTRFIAGTSQATSLVAAGVPMAAPAISHPAPVVGSAAASSAADAGREMGSEGGPLPIPTVRVPLMPPETSAPVRASEPVAEEAPAGPAARFEPPKAAAKAEAAVEFDVRRLPQEEQELHRRASRVAKVSMQDIKMLRPNDVKDGRKSKDLCTRLRADIDKARKEYDRRFKVILSHPVDYFYDWMVDILADGDASSLGDYPYPRSTGRQ
ncbi:MAG: hypothetical protein ACRD5W_14075, partial [Candidatus Acidiferrales bacterium]